MSNPELFIGSQLPSHYRTYYPLFITFMEKYYEWLYRNIGFNSQEIELLKAEQVWLKTNIDRYITSGELRYSGAGSEDTVIIEMSNQKSGEAFVDYIIPQYFLERTFKFFEENEDELFVTADDYELETPEIDQRIIDLWLYKMGFPTIAQNNFHGNYDQFLLIKCLKYIYSIKGTSKSVQLFFNIFFNEVIADTDILYPKFDIAIIDDTCIADGKYWIRDDDYYNEYSYVVKVQNDPSYYKDIMDSIYYPYIHASGFKLFLVQK